MVKPESFQEFTEVANRYARGISNDFITPGTAEKLIRAGRLLYEGTENALLIFEERDGYYKLTFRVRDSSFRLAETVPENLAAFTVHKGAPGKVGEWLSENGFVMKQERVRYSAEKILVEPAEFFETVDASVAYPIYRQCFDMTIADLPCPELFEGALCVRDGKGNAAGVLSLGADRHIGVLPEYRGQGIATRLYAMLVRREPDLGTQRLFADVDNPASNGLYRKLGYKTDGVILRCYTK